MNRLLLAGLGIVMFGTSFLEARPVDFSTPNNSFGAANPFGYLRIWRELGEMDFGDGLVLPIRVEFSSDYEKPSLYIGKGWSCPVLESKVYLANERLMMATLPCGKIMYLRRDKKDLKKFFTLDKEWTAKIDEEKVTITRDDGWELRYANGHLRQLKTDHNRILTWVKRGELVSEIREEGKGTAQFRVDVTSTGEPTGFNMAGKSFTFEMGKRPKVESTSGINVIGGFEPTLTGFKWPDGQTEKYEFAVDEQILPTLKVTDLEKQEANYSWDPSNKHILSDGEWNYRVGEMTKESTVPKLYRTNSKGEEEFLFITSKQGLTERKTLKEGHTITEVFKSPGLLYDKVRSIQKITESGELKTLYKISYNEEGKMLRKVDKDGFTYLYSDDEGNDLPISVIAPTDPEILSKLAESERAIKGDIVNSANKKDLDNSIQQLAMFYLIQKKDKRAALSLTDYVSDSKIKYNIKFFAIESDVTLPQTERINQLNTLIAEFPNQKNKTQFIIDSYKK